MRPFRFALPLFAVLVFPLGVRARPVTAAEARTAAANWLGRTPAPLGAKVAAPAASGVRTVAGADGEPLFHVVRMEGGGLVVTSAETGVEPIVAFSGSNGLLEAEDSPLRAILLADMASRTRQVRGARSRKRTPGAPDPFADAEAAWAGLLAGRKGGRTSVSDERVAPLLSTRWNQGDDPDRNHCANLYTPNHYLCGCVAVAGAQIAHYWRFPTESRPSVTRSCSVSGSGVDKATQGGVYAWDSMPDAFDSASAAQREAIGKLCYDFGVATYMDWDSTSSGTGGYCLADAFTTVFGYASARTYVGSRDGAFSDALVERCVFACLDAGSPVAIGLDGHEAVADGYGYVSGQPYTHINLGWGGADDAWYRLPTVDGRQYQSTVLDEVVYNVFPQGAGDLLTGRVLDPSGAPVAGATVRAVCGSASATATSDARGVYALRVGGGQSWLVTASDVSGASPSTNVWVDASQDTEVFGDSYFPDTGSIGNSWGNDLVLVPRAESVEGEAGGTFPAGARVLCGRAAHGDLVPGSLRISVGDCVWEDDGSGSLVFRGPEGEAGTEVPVVSESLGNTSLARYCYVARLSRPPAPGTVSIAIGGVGSFVDNNGSGALEASGVSGTGVVNYANGVVAFGFYNNPPEGLSIEASYRPAAADDGLPRAGSGVVLHSSGAWTVRTDSAMPTNLPAVLEYDFRAADGDDPEVRTETADISAASGLVGLDNVVPGSLMVSAGEYVWVDTGTNALAFRDPGADATDGSRAPSVARTDSLGTIGEPRFVYGACLASDIVPGSVAVRVGDDGALFDDGAGGLVAFGVLGSGRVNYATGAVSIQFDGLPDSGLPLLVDYRAAADCAAAPPVARETGATASQDYRYGFALGCAVVPGTVVVRIGDGGGAFFDEGDGCLVGMGVNGSGTVNYGTGDIQLTFFSSLADGLPIRALYRPASSAVFSGSGEIQYPSGAWSVRATGSSGAERFVMHYARRAARTPAFKTRSEAFEPSGGTNEAGRTAVGSLVPGSVQIAVGEAVWTDDGAGALVFRGAPDEPGDPSSAVSSMEIGTTEEFLFSYSASIGVPVEPGSVTVAIGTNGGGFSDAGDGTLVGNGVNGRGQVIYETGGISFQFDASPGDGLPIVATYVPAGGGGSATPVAPPPGTIRYETGEWEIVPPAAFSGEDAVVRYSFVPEDVPEPVFRFYSKNYKGHFFTIDEGEKDDLIAGNPNWKYEGVAYRAYTNEAAGTTALYRFYSKSYRGHFFTIDEDEMWTVRNTNPNWKYEGVAYYVYPDEVEGSVPVYRFWSKAYRHHFYTIDEAEKDNLIATNPNWKYEGVAFYALPVAAIGEGTALVADANAAAPAPAGARVGGVPSAPTGVSASDGTYTDRIRVSWSASAGAASYAVYRSGSVSGEKAVVATTLGTSVDDTSASVLPGMTYYYWVKARNEAGESGFSSYDTGWKQIHNIAPCSVFRFYSKNYKGHFFTIDEAEKDDLIATNPNWKYEGVAYRAFKEQASGTVALYRFYSKNYRGHFFTVDPEEAETVKLNPNWNYEGIAYYVLNSPDEIFGSVPVYRFWSKGYRHHFYTTNEAEKDDLIAHNPNWKYEGIAFYALPALDANAAAPAPAPAGKGAQRALRDAHAVAWTLAADGTAIAVPGVTAADDMLVEARLDAPDADELTGDDPASVGAETLELRLSLPGGAFDAALWSAAAGVVADEPAEGAFDFALPASGVWHWLRVRDAADEDAADAYSLWLRAE